MTRTSHRIPWRHADPNQSDRPRSTSSTNSYLFGGKLRRNASFSSAELTVMLQTVFFSAFASCAQTAANNAVRKKSLVKGAIGPLTDGVHGKRMTTGSNRQ